MGKTKIMRSFISAGLMAFILFTGSGLNSGKTEAGETEGEGTRIETLLMDADLYKYNDSLELVALAPGCGWLRLKTRDGISPTLSLKCIRQDEVLKFNLFSKQIGEPIRISVEGNVLKVLVEENHQKINKLLENEYPEGKHGLIKINGFYQPGAATPMIIKKGDNGTCFIQIQVKE